MDLGTEQLDALPRSLVGGFGCQPIMKCLALLGAFLA
jgi:hypothetical protein